MEEAVEDKVETEQEPQEEKAVQTAEIVSPFVPFGVSTFEDLEAAQQAKVTAQMAETLSEQFRSIVSNIMANPDIEDKAGAVTSLAAEFSTRINAAMVQKEIDQEQHYKEVAEDEFKAINDDFQGGCGICGFGEPAIMKELSKCPFCWNGGGDND